MRISSISGNTVGLVTPRGRLIGPMPTKKSKSVPSEFREGDEVEVADYPTAPALTALGIENGHCVITHVRTGKELWLWYKAKN
jgi:hypothetical protein